MPMLGSKKDQNYSLYMVKAIRSLPMASFHIPHFDEIGNCVKRQYLDFILMIRAGLFAVNTLREIEKDMDSVFSDIRGLGHGEVDKEQVADLFRIGILMIEKYRKMVLGEQ